MSYALSLHLLLGSLLSFLLNKFVFGGYGGWPEPTGICNQKVPPGYSCPLKYYYNKMMDKCYHVPHRTMKRCAAVSYCNDMEGNLPVMYTNYTGKDKSLGDSANHLIFNKYIKFFKTEVPNGDGTDNFAGRGVVMAGYWIAMHKPYGTMRFFWDGQSPKKMVDPSVTNIIVQHEKIRSNPHPTSWYAKQFMEFVMVQGKWSNKGRLYAVPSYVKGNVICEREKTLVNKSMIITTTAKSKTTTKPKKFSRYNARANSAKKSKDNSSSFFPVIIMGALGVVAVAGMVGFVVMRNSASSALPEEEIPEEDAKSEASSRSSGHGTTRESNAAPSEMEIQDMSADELASQLNTA